MNRATIERRLVQAEQRAARMVPLHIPVEVEAWLATLTTAELEAVEKALDMLMGLQPK
jgi:hypothetical protein